MEEVEEDTDKEVVEETVAHMKMELTPQLSSVNLNIQSETHSYMIQGKVSLRTHYAKSSWQIKRSAPPDM